PSREPYGVLQKWQNVPLNSRSVTSTLDTRGRRQGQNSPKTDGSRVSKVGFEALRRPCSWSTKPARARPRGGGHGSCETGFGRCQRGPQGVELPGGNLPRFGLGDATGHRCQPQ